MKGFQEIISQKNFLYLWASQILSQLTINIMNFLLLIRLFEATGSSVATSFLWVAYALPAIFIGPFASASIDMLERRKVLIITNFFQSLTIFIYAFVHETQVFLLYGVAIAYSFLNQFYIPAEAASLPSLVKKKILPSANGLFLLTQQAALVIGFGMAGVLKQVIGFEKSLFLCSAFIFLAFLSVLMLPKIYVHDKIPKDVEKALIKFFTRIFEGYQYIKDHRVVLIPFLLLMAMQISLAMIMVNVPLIAKDLLEIELNSAGLLVITPAGLGAACSAIVIPMLLRKGLRKRKTIEFSLFVISLALLLINFLIPLLSGVIKILLSSLFIFAIGMSFVGVIIPAQTLLQEKTPGGLRGRIFGNFWFLVTIATIFPVVLSGAISELFGIRFLIFVLCIISVLALIFSYHKKDQLFDENKKLWI